MPILLDIDAESIEPSIDSALKKLAKAQGKLNFAENAKLLKDAEDNVYITIYDAARIICEGVLIFFGYRVKQSTKSHHYKVINFASQLMEGKLKNEFTRIQKMRNKRQQLEYGDSSPVSQQELAQAHKDVAAFLIEVGKLIEDNNPNKNPSFL